MRVSFCLSIIRERGCCELLYGNSSGCDRFQPILIDLTMLPSRDLNRVSEMELTESRKK